MAGYTRTDTTNNIATGNVINASDLDNEYDAIQAAYNATTGHTHGGALGEGAPITRVGPVQDVVVSGSAVTPKTDNVMDLGSSSLEFKDLWIDGTANIDSLVADTADINGGTVDGVTLGTNSAVTEAQIDNVNINGNAITTTNTNGNLALTPNGTGEVDISKVDIDSGTIDGTVIGGSSAAAGTFTTATATTGNITTVNATTVDTTNLEVTAIKAKDGTAAATIADATGVVTIPSAVLTTADINGGTIDGTTIGGASAAAGTFTTATATTGNITTVNATTVNTTNLDLTNLEVTNIKAKDGTASATIADSTGVMTVASAVLTTADINGGTVDGAVIGGASAAAGNFTTLSASGAATFSAGTVSAPAITTTGDTNTGIYFPAADTIGFTEGGVEALRLNANSQTSTSIAGTASLPSFTRTGDENTGIFFPAADTIAFTEGGVESMRIDSAGNLGLGTSSPLTRLNTQADSTNSDLGQLVISGNTSSSKRLSLGFHTTSNYGFIQALIAGDNYYPLVLQANGGNVGIGTSSPAFKLDIRGSQQALINATNPTSWVSVDSGLTTGSMYSQFNTSSNLGISGTYTNHPYALYTNNIERMRIDSSGNVGIGTSSPNSAGVNRALTISGSSNSILELNAGSTRCGYMYATTAATIFSAVQASSIMQFNTVDTERMRITSGGVLIIGGTAATAPGGVGTARLQAINSLNDGGWIQTIQSSGASVNRGLAIEYSGATPNDGFNEAMYFTDATAVRFILKSNGGISNYSGNNTNLSDVREKNNIELAGAYLKKICSIPVKTFNYIDQNRENDDGLTLGVIAQEVQAVAPELVSESNWGTKDEPKMRLSIYQTDLQYALMKSIQELKSELDSVKAELQTLKGN